MGLRHAFNLSQPWVRIWFQNLAKDYPGQEGSQNWINFRGSITPARDTHRRLGFRYEFSIPKFWKGIFKHIAFDVTCYGGDGHSDAQLHVAFFFFQVFFTIENFFGFYPKKKNGNYWNPMSTGIRMDWETISIHIWYDCHESRSDGSTHIFNFYKWWPWTWAAATSWEVQTADGSFVPRADGDYPDRRKEFEWPYKDGRKMYIDVYHYKLRRGEWQKRIATYHVSRMTWHKRYQKWPFMSWAKWPVNVRTSIDVRFNDEVGERSGSWKGGTIGCSYEMLPGETPQQTLRRMEKERKFT